MADTHYYSLAPMIQILGKPIHNRNNQTIGRIKDLVIDAIAGQIRYAIISYRRDICGQWSEHCLPWHLLYFEKSNDIYLVDISEVDIERSPSSANNLDDCIKWERIVLMQYEIPPYWIQPRD